MQSFLVTRSKFPINPICRFSRLCLVLLALLAAPLWAQTGARVSVPLADIHRHPSRDSERVTQVFLGDHLQVVKSGPQWTQVLVAEQYRTPKGYPGFIESHLLTPVKDTSMHADQVTVSSASARLFPTGGGQNRKVFLGTRLKLVRRLPDGDCIVSWPGETSTFRVSGQEVGEERPIGDGQSIIATARKLEGTPYLWGGMSGKGIDCSGLVYATYRRHGYTLPRDADQQALVGRAVGRDQLSMGDLVYFGSRADDITHIGLYLKDGLFVHASKGAGVSVGDLRGDYYRQRFQGGRRILRSGLSEPQVETPGDPR